LQTNADANAADLSSLSPLYRASQFGHRDVAQLMLSHGADVNQAESTNATTPAYIAAYNGNVDILELLVNASADLHHQELTYGAHPLLVAAMNNHPAAVSMCLDLNADINKTNSAAATPLFIACQKGNLDVVKLLVARNADLGAENSDGESPLAAATAKGRLHIVRFLNQRIGVDTGTTLESLESAAWPDCRIERCESDDFEGIDYTAATATPREPETPHQARTRLRKEKLAKLLPGEKPPPEVQLCLKKEWGGYATVTHQERIKATIDWLVDALCSAYLDRTIKATSCQLLREHGYTANLAFASSLAPLKTGLEDRLAELGAQLDSYYDEQDLANVLSDESVGRFTRFHPLVAGAQGTETQLSQAAILPTPTGYFDFGDVHPENMDERCYLHVILMVSIAVDRQFQDKVQAIADQFNLTAYQFQRAEPKAYSRALNKMISDYRYADKPRCGLNIDTIRNLAVLEGPKMLLEFYASLIESFNGIAKLKNMFMLPPGERAKRFHLVFLMATVVFDTGMTYSDLCSLPETQQIWDNYYKNPDGEPEERWQRHVERARIFLQSSHVADEKVVVLGEVQILMQKYADIRHQMHEPYKVWRAGDQNQLHQDYLRTAGNKAAETQPNVLYNAAYRGQMQGAIRMGGSGVVRRMPRRGTTGCEPVRNVAGLRKPMTANAKARSIARRCSGLIAATGCTFHLAGRIAIDRRGRPNFGVTRR